MNNNPAPIAFQKLLRCLQAKEIMTDKRAWCLTDNKNMAIKELNQSRRTKCFGHAIVAWIRVDIDSGAICPILSSEIE